MARRRGSMLEIQTSPIFSPDPPVLEDKTPVIRVALPAFPDAKAQAELESACDTTPVIRVTLPVSPDAKAELVLDSASDTTEPGSYAEGIDMDFQPPPGLPPPVVTPPSFEVPFWPDIKRQIIDPAHCPPQPNPHCTLCTRPLAITGLNTSPQPADDQEPAAVLPCGHIFGAVCLSHLTSPSHTHPPSCPTCNLLLIHPQCNHPLPPFLLPTTPHPTTSSPAAVPPTLPEGGSIPPACPSCRVGMAWWHLRMAEAVLFEPGVYGPTWEEMVDPVTGTDHRGLWESRAVVGRVLQESFATAVCAAHVMGCVRPGWGGMWPGVVV